MDRRRLAGFVESTMIKVAKIKCLSGYRVHAAFSDGMAGEYDFSTIVAESGPMVEPLSSSRLRVGRLEG